MVHPICGTSNVCPVLCNASPRCRLAAPLCAGSGADSCRTLPTGGCACGAGVTDAAAVANANAASVGLLTSWNELPLNMSGDAAVPANPT